MYKSITDHLVEQRTEWNKVHSTHGGETRSVYEKGGRTFQTYIFNTESEANSFLTKNKGHGIIGRNGYQIHIAKLSAKGRTTHHQTKDGDVK